MLTRFTFLCLLLGAPSYLISQQSNFRGQSVAGSYEKTPYRSGEQPGAYHPLDYYPTYYHDSGYYYNPREEYGRRMGDWDYHNGWQYNRDAYLKGETQSEYYRGRHPYGPGGIGYSPDEGYLHL